MKLEEIAKTQDPGLQPIPVFKIEKSDKSFMTFMFPGNGRMRVHHVFSENGGDMKEMMDYAVQHFGVSEVEFWNVLNPKLMKKKLNGFTLKERYSPQSEITHTIMAGEWKIPEK